MQMQNYLNSVHKCTQCKKIWYMNKYQKKKDDFFSLATCVVLCVRHNIILMGSVDIQNSQQQQKLLKYTMENVENTTKKK